MSNVLDAIVKNGYEAHSIRDDEALPCSLVKDGVPAGFLMADFTVTLLPSFQGDYEKLRRSVDFAIDNAGLKQMANGAYSLTQYKDTVLTADYDYVAQKPVYSVYKLKEGDLSGQPLMTSDSREAAAQYYSSVSNLLGKDIAIPGIAERHRNRLMEELTPRGYTLVQREGSSSRAYEIVNQNNELVSYVDRRGKLEHVTRDAAERRLISSAYRRSDPAREQTPGFFGRLKSAFSSIGLGLRLIFTKEGAEVAVNQGSRQVAYMDSQQSLTDFSPDVSPEMREKLDKALQEFKSGQTKTAKEEVEPSKASKQKEKAMGTESPENSLTIKEMEELLVAVASVPDVNQSLSPELSAKLDALTPQTAQERPAKSISLEQRISSAREGAAGKNAGRQTQERAPKEAAREV